MLTAEQVDRYRYDGYLSPLPALSPGEIEICLAGLEAGDHPGQVEWRERRFAAARL